MTASGKYRASWFLFGMCLLLLGVQLVLERLRGTHGLDVRPRAQFKSMEAALELFRDEFGDYPPSDACDPLGHPYCGAMKLAEAVFGKDMLGFHCESCFRRDGLDKNGGPLYGQPYLPQAELDETRRGRTGPYLEPQNIGWCQLEQLYGRDHAGPLPPNAILICDVYGRTEVDGRNVGMPILYYKARTGKTDHDPNDPNSPDNTYDYRDNHALLALGMPGNPSVRHPLYQDPRLFYKLTQRGGLKHDRPAKPDGFVLWTAGADGLYGTDDDITN